MVLKKLLLILIILFAACVIAGVNQYQAASGVVSSRPVTFQITFFIYYISSLLLLAIGHKKLNSVLILVMIFLPVALLTVNGLTTSWEALYPYHFPYQTLVIIWAEVIAYFLLNSSIIKKVVGYFVSGVVLYLLCLLIFERSVTEIKEKHVETYKVNDTESLVLHSLVQKLIDTSGRKLVLNPKDFYILNFSTHTSAPCQIKLQFLQEFAAKIPDNLKVIYVANSGAETFGEFKSKLKATKNDKIIYAYLYEQSLLKKLDIDKYPVEIMVAPGFKLLRKQLSFYDFDASSYEQQTLELLKK